jgi:tetratricopeptide (TPR) repeat protein
MSISRFTTLFVMTFLISPVACLAQSQFTEAMKLPSAPKNDSTVSVQELRMSDKGRKAFDKGAALLEKGNAAASLAYFDQAITEFPGFYKAYYDLGIAHYRLGHTIEAEQAFQISIDLTGGGYAPPEFGMGMVLCQKQELEKAETVIQRGLDLEPGSAIGKYFLGLAQFGLNHLVEAERSVQQAILRKANFAQAYFLLARIHQRQNNSPAVAEDLQAFLKLDPHSRDSKQARAFLKQTQQTQQAQQTSNQQASSAHPP